MGLRLSASLNFSVDALYAAGSIALKPRLLGDFRQRLNGRRRSAMRVHQSKKCADANAVGAQETKP